MDTHGMKFTLDTTDVAKGFRDYKSAVDGIFKSLDKFEAHVAKTMQGVAKSASNPAAVNALKKSLGGLSDVNIDPSVARKMSALSAAMAGFKAPSAQQSANLKTFFNSFKTFPDLGKAYRSVKAIDDINIAMRGFQAPSAAQSANLTRFTKALQGAAPGFEALGRLKGLSGGLGQLNAMSAALSGLKVPSTGQITNLGNLALAFRAFNFGNLQNSGNFFAAIAALKDFRAPTAGQTKNLENFVHAVNNIHVPANGSAISTYLHAISTAAAQANGNMVRFRGGIGQTGNAFGPFNMGVRSAHIEMMGLQNAFSGTFQVGSLLRSLLGSLTIGELGRKFFDATQTANQFAASMEVLNDKPAFRAEAWNRVTEAANHFGADLTEYSENFAKFAVAAHESGMSLKESFKVYEGFQTVMTALHLGTQQQQSVGLAIREIMDRGYVSTQQLTRQLGLVLPGALATLQKEWVKAGHAEGTFFDALKKKQVDGKWALDELANHYRDVYGKAVAQALESPIQQFNILRNNITKMMIAISDAGAKKAFADLIGQISGYLDPGKVQGFATAIGEGLTKAVHKVSAAVAWLHDHWDEIKGPLSTILSLTGRWMMMTAAFKLTQGLVTPLINAVIYTKELVKWTRALDFAQAAGNAQGMLTTLRAMNTPLKTLGGLMAGLAPTTGFRLLGMMADPINTLRTAVSGLTGMFSGLGTAIKTGLTTPIEGGVAAAAATIISGFTLAFGSVLAVAHANGIQMASDQYSTAEKIKGAFLYAGDAISGIWNAVTNWINAKAVWLGGILGIPFKGAADFIGTAFMGISYVFLKVGQVLIGAAQTIGEGIARTIMAPINAMKHAAAGDFALAGADIGDFFGGGFAKAAQNRLGSIKFGKADFADYVKNAAIGTDYLLTKMGERGRGKPPKAPAGPPKPAWQDAVGDGPFDSEYKGVGKGGDGGKGKANKAFNQLKAFESALDSYMTKLEDSDPVSKLMQTWRKDVDEGAKLLLGPDGYMSVLKDAGDKTTDVHQRTEALIRAIQSGKLSAVAKKGLAARGLTPEQLVSDLRAWESAQDDKLIEALSKDYDQHYKALTRVFQRLGKHDPMVKAKTDFLDAFRQNAKDTLDPAGYKAMLPVFTKLMEGTISAADATKAFNEQLTNGHAAAGISISLINQLTEANNQEAKAQVASLILAERQNDVVGEFLRKKQDENNVLRMSADNAKVAADLQQVINDGIAKHHMLTQQQIEVTRTRLEQLQEENKLLARQREIYESNGLRTYVKDSQSTADVVNKLDHDTFQGLEDTLFNLSKTGKLSFSSMLDSIEEDLLRFASKNITRSLMDAIIPGASRDLAAGKSPTLWGKGGIGKALGFAGKNGSGPFDAKNNPSGDMLAGTDKIGGSFQISELGDISTSFSQSMQQTFPTLAQQFQEAMSGGIAGVSQGGTTGRTATGKAFDKAFGGGLGDSGAAIKTPLASTAANDNAIASSPAIESASKATAGSFAQTMQGMMPMIGLAFAGSFKSPIAQIGSMFAMMLMQKMMSSGGGGGGGLLGSLFKIGMSVAAPQASLVSSASSAMAANAAIFKEGGYVGSPVSSAMVNASAFTRAPHYAEGTHNTSGGLPAILHDNEAVIPLSRNRKIPIEGGGHKQTIVQNWNIQTPDADSFRKSRQQIASDMHSMAARSYRRNRG